MPDRVYLFPNINSIGDRGFTTTEPDKTCEGMDYDAYYHDRTLKAKDVEIAELKARLEIDANHPYDGIYTRDETIKMLEENSKSQKQTFDALLKKYKELEAQLEARGE